MDYFSQTKQLIDLVVRVPKKNAAFFYFILESQENLCFFSTLDESLQTPYRDISIRGTIEFKDDIINTITLLQKQFPLEILRNEVINDK